MKANIVVQLTGATLDKMYKGCLGITLVDKGPKTTVGIYTPQQEGKNAFVKKVDFNDGDLTVVGEVPLKPLN